MNAPRRSPSRIQTFILPIFLTCIIRRPLAYLLQTAHSERCPPNKTFVIPVPKYGDCFRYYHCANGTLHMKSCPYGSVFNIQYRYCSPCMGMTQMHFLAHKACPAGTSFNSATKQCDLNDNIVRGCHAELFPQCHYCPSDDATPIPFLDDCSSYIECKSGIHGVKKCPQGTVFNGTGCQKGECNRTLESSFCRNHSDARMPIPFPDDCSLFAMCVDEIPVIKRCPIGTVFDLEKSFCVWPKNTRRKCENDFEPPYPTGLTRSHTPGTPPTPTVKSCSRVPQTSVLLAIVSSLVHFGKKKTDYHM